jgi:hypothetical protein
MQSTTEPQVPEAPRKRFRLFPGAGMRLEAQPEVPVPDEESFGAVEPQPASRRFPSFGVLLFVAASVVLFVATAAIYFASLTNNLSVEGDNAIYMILAKAMNVGHGYTDVQGPIPRLEAQYPPLFPLMLIPIVRVFGIDGVLQMQGLVTCFTLASFVVGFFLFRRWTGNAVLALAIILATAESDLVWSFSHKVLTEIPYLFFTLLTCWLVTRYRQESGWRTWTGFLVVLATGAMFLTRTVGVSMCAAVPAYLLLAPPLRDRSEWKLRLWKALAACSGTAVIAGGWTLRNRLVFSGQGHNYIGQFFLKQAYVPDNGRVSSNELLSRMADNASYYADQFQRTLVGHEWDRFTTAPAVSHVLIACAVVGFAFALCWRRTIAEFYVAGYVLIVLLWPWQDLRFAVPIMPFLFYYVAMAGYAPLLAVSRIRRFNPSLLTGLAIILLTTPTGAHTFHIARDDRSAGYHYQSDKLGEWVAYADWQDFHAAAMWLKAHVAPGSTVINRSPNIFYLWTGLASRNYPYSFDTWSVMKDVSMEPVDYVLFDDFSWTYTTNLYMKPVINRFPDRFVLLHTFRGAKVYKVVHTPPS